MCCPVFRFSLFSSFFQDAWVNEKFSPELLEPQTEIIDCLMEQIARTEEHLATLDKGHFAIALHKMELQRVRFLVGGCVKIVGIGKICESVYSDKLSKLQGNHISIAQLRTGKNACTLIRAPSLDNAMSQSELATVLLYCR